MAFRNTAAGEAFVASAASRETSPEIMEAIAAFARDEGEAVAFWEDGEVTGVCTLLDIWERVTKNGLHDATEFCWGAAGRQWWEG